MVTIIGTKHNVRCNEFSRQWGVYLDENNELPAVWDVCLKCASRDKSTVIGKNSHVKKENVNNNGYNRNIK